LLAEYKNAVHQESFVIIDGRAIGIAIVIAGLSRSSAKQL